MLKKYRIAFDTMYMPGDAKGVMNRKDGMICTLIDRLNAGDWEMSNAVYAKLKEHQDSPCE